jgi:hypothetical protein
VTHWRALLRGISLSRSHFFAAVARKIHEYSFLPGCREIPMIRLLQRFFLIVIAASLVAPTSVDWVFIQQYDGTSDGYSVGADKGLFYHIGVKPGPYQVTQFGGSGFLAGDVIYNFPDTGRNDTALIVEQPGAYFAGSFGYQKIKTGIFEQKQFDIQPIDSPTEAAVLQKVRKRMRKDNPEYRHAIALVERRIAELQSVASAE